MKEISNLIIEGGKSYIKGINIKPLQNIYYLAPKFFDEDSTHALRAIVIELIIKLPYLIRAQYKSFSLILPMFSIYNKNTHTLSIVDEKYDLTSYTIDSNSRKILYDFIISNQSRTINKLIIRRKKPVAELFLDILRDHYIPHIPPKKKWISKLASKAKRVIITSRKSGSTVVKKSMAPLFLPHLTSLDLSGNQIKDEGAKLISFLVRLTTLNLRDNEIGNVGAIYISSLNNLTYLDISYNLLKYKGAQPLYEGLPNCKIHINIDSVWS